MLRLEIEMFLLKKKSHKLIILKKIEIAKKNIFDQIYCLAFVVHQTTRNLIRTKDCRLLLYHYYP